MNLVEDAKKRFEVATKEHQMTVLRDDGLYRHLRFQRPDTSIYYFDFITWPGYLTIVGDCGTYVFTRLADMFEFFESDHGEINPQYWAEKLRAPSPDGAKRYSEERYRDYVKGWIRDHAERLSQQVPVPSGIDFRMHGIRVAEQVLLDDDELPFTEHEARERLNEFEHDGLVVDHWEWDLRDYDFQFLWCCHAIVWGIAQYRKEGDLRR